MVPQPRYSGGGYHRPGGNLPRRDGGNCANAARCCWHGGETIATGTFNFRVLWTPGHTPGHICLYAAEQKLLLAGDHITEPAASASINLYPNYSAASLDEFLASLEELGQMGIDLILPGHGTPFRGIRDWIEQRKNYHEQKKAAILEKLGSGTMNAHQLSVAMTHPIDWPQLGAFHKRRAILETLAHLESLRSNGKLSKFDHGGTVYYRLR